MRHLALLQRVGLAAAGLLMLASCTGAEAHPSSAAPTTTPAEEVVLSSFPFEQVEAAFRAMKEAGWNTDAGLLWGYFFTHADPDRLKAVAKKLQGMGYRVVSIHATEDRSHHVLHVERVETLSPQALDRRNHELNSLAWTFGVVYDGWDAGPVGNP